MTARNPIFLHLTAKYAELRDAGLDETPEASELFGEMMRYAPSEYQKVAHDLAVEAGLMPATPDAHSEDGEPLYFLEGIAKRLGIDHADIPKQFKEQSHQGNIHLVN